MKVVVSEQNQPFMNFIANSDSEPIAFSNSARCFEHFLFLPVPVFSSQSVLGRCMMAQESVDGSMLKPRLRLGSLRTKSVDLITAIRPGKDIAHPISG